jgi:hypothetical protein
MFEKQQRKYYKIFTGTNQEEGYDKIHLGYEAETFEIVFKKDNTTFFHVPYFSTIQNILTSSLVSEGVTAGPIPALSDRIFKKKRNYGNTTPYGSTKDPDLDGTWFCTWLCEISAGNFVWMDRYYNPNTYTFTEEDLYELEPLVINYSEYKNLSAVFTDLKNYYDIPSSLTLEPEVFYQYFRQGEKTSQELVTTFSGNDKDRLKLNIEEWSLNTQDTSIYNNSIVFDKFNTEWVKTIESPSYQDRSFLSFDHTDFINCQVIYNGSYNSSEEFTVNFWTSHPNWSDATSSQLLGNIKRGGYGVFYNSLHSYPFFIIPETSYGHIFYCNQEKTIYLDKNTKSDSTVYSNPPLATVTSEYEVIHTDLTQNRLIKYNHLGDVITLSKDTSGNVLNFEGVPKFLILDGDNNTTLITTSATYTYDADLILSSIQNTPYQNNEQIGYNLSGVLVRESNCLDIKFDNLGQKWIIKPDQKVYCNNVLVASVSGEIVTGLAIDPENNIWCLANKNETIKIDPFTKTVITKFQIGLKSLEYSARNISFIKNYERQTNKHTWIALFVHNFEKTLYFTNLNGKIVKYFYLPDKVDITDVNTLDQNINLIDFNSYTDFTGYERNRIFGIHKYKNQHHLEIKISTKPNNPYLPNSTKTLSIPVNFTNEEWYCVTLVFKKRELICYINGIHKGSYPLLPSHIFNYDFKNNLYIGCPTGKTQNLNKEIESESIIWNGYMDSIKIYDYGINEKFLPVFLREKTIATDLIWNIKTIPLQYVETIERFFAHKLPGNKSIFYNLKIAGHNITDSNLRQKIEQEFHQIVQKIQPAYTDLLKIEWV